MNRLDDLLQERLARLEAGEPLEACLSDLPEGEATLMRKAVLLRSMTETDPVSEGVAIQRRELLRLVQEKKMPSQSPTTRKAQPRWLLPGALVSGAFTLMACITIFSLLVGLAGLRWFNGSFGVAQNPTPVSRGTPAPDSTPDKIAPTILIEAPDPQSAALDHLRGIVEVQPTDGTWKVASTGTVIKAGQRVRTGALSSVTLSFYDSSQVRLGPNSEIALDELNASKTGPRVVVLTQWVGESNHDVAASSDTTSKYEVHTPSGTGTAKGTSFHVFVSTTLLVRFDVDEGAVDVTSLNVIVVVVAGQSTVIIPGQPPAGPFFRMTGEGKVERIGTSWRIAGRMFQTNNNTVIVGDPQVGDWVAFEARIMPDGTRFADQIVLLRRAVENKFAFVGEVGTIAEEAWTIAGRVVQVDELTAIEPGIEVGNLVKVRGGLTQDGTLWAASIQRVVTNGFKFTGVVQSITPDLWTVSSITVTVNLSTTSDPGIVVGDLVLVTGHISEDNTWLAHTIRRALVGGGPFEMVGVVMSLDPWIVNGIELTITDETEIDQGIKVGDRVKVEGRILADGTWLAEEIQLLDDEKPQRFHFVGIVTSINPWVVGGIPLAVDESTKVDDDIEVGNLVRVKGVIQTDGTWLAEKIKRLERNRGCLNLSTVVRQVDTEQIVLLDWQTVRLGQEIKVEGELKVATVIIVSGCVREDGTLIIINIVVIYQLDQLPIIIIPPGNGGGGGGGGGDDDDDDDDD